MKQNLLELAAMIAIGAACLYLAFFAAKIFFDILEVLIQL